jgi:hypothetical protein
MIREFEKKIEKFIAEKIPDPVKLVFFYGLAFCLGYTVGDFGYENYEEVVKIMCQL